MIDVNDNSNANGNGALDPKNEEEPKAIKIAKELQRPDRCRSRTSIRRARNEATTIYRRIDNLKAIVSSLALS